MEYSRVYRQTGHWDWALSAMHLWSLLSLGTQYPQVKQWVTVYLVPLRHILQSSWINHYLHSGKYRSLFQGYFSRVCKWHRCILQTWFRTLCTFQKVVVFIDNWGIWYFRLIRTACVQLGSPLWIWTAHRGTVCMNNIFGSRELQLDLYGK